MTYTKIIEQIELIAENYEDGAIDGGELVEYLQDLVNDIKNSDGGFGMGGEHYEEFEETDFTNLKISD